MNKFLRPVGSSLSRSPYVRKQFSVVNAKSVTDFIGKEVQLLEGGKGIVVEKGNGGWWKVLVRTAQDTNADSSNVISVRSSGFKLIGSLSPTVVPCVSSSALKAPGSRFPLQTIPTPNMHSQVRDWVLFSDLHVKSSSIETCEEVLDLVHAAAVERNAGIVFLGDFWHVRGALNVELLNRVLKCLGRWTQPVIMIPGNHDQVSLGGMVHALEPLAYAFQNPEQVSASCCAVYTVYAVHTVYSAYAVCAKFTVLTMRTDTSFICFILLIFFAGSQHLGYMLSNLCASAVCCYIVLLIALSCAQLDISTHTHGMSSPLHITPHTVQHTSHSRTHQIPHNTKP
jgi:hypothetical protein